MTVHDQRSLADALRSGETDIVLDGGKYRIPLNKPGITYKGRNGAIVGFTGKGEVYLDDYSISISGCAFDDDARSRLTDTIEVPEDTSNDDVEYEPLSPSEEYRRDKEDHLDRAKKHFAKGNISDANFVLCELYWRAKSVHDFKTAYDALSKIHIVNDIDRERKLIYSAEMLCCMGRDREGISQFESIIKSYGESSIAELAVILLARYYHRKGNFIKENFWYLYGKKKFGAYGAWEYYDIYDEQWNVVYYGDDDDPYYIDK